MIASVLVAGPISRAEVGAESRPSVGHPLARNQSNEQMVEESTDCILVPIREYMAGHDVRWLYNIIFE